MMVIDDNEEFVRFVTAHLQHIYDLHAYCDMKTATADMEVLKADIIVCKHDMAGMTGSELCNRIKTNPRTENVRFVIMTDGVLTTADMKDMNVTLSADDYLAKPFNIQEAVMRFNRLLGLAPDEGLDNVIEGKETRMLEGYNSSMTTATTSDNGNISHDTADIREIISEKEEDTDWNNDSMTGGEEQTDGQAETAMAYYDGKTIGDYSMNSIMDRQLMRNVEQYVLQNMSRGQINMEEMAAAMGMGRVPFFHKIKSITKKTPAELVRELRLKHACTLLRHTNINMSELAINLGFMTAENFTIIFKDKYGVSPLEYRLQQRKG